MLFNEIIVLNLFGISKDVKSNIIKRGENEKKEMIEMNYSVPDDNNDDEEVDESLTESFNSSI